MFVKNLDDCPEFIANDGCHIRELLHPQNDPIDLPYSIAIATVETGKHTYKHQLQQDEIYYLFSGEGKLHVDNETRILRTGDVALIPAHTVQWIENTGDIELTFAAIVSPPWREEDDQRVE